MPIASASYAITKLNDGLTTFYQYAKHSSNTTAPTTGWSDLMPASEAGKFIWRREAKALSLGLIGSGDWGGAVCLTGATGDPGLPGAPGKGITSIVVEYYKSSSMEVLEGGIWDTVVPVVSGEQFIWSRTRTFFSDSTSVTTDPVCITGPPGINGDPGRLGLYAVGTTLHLRGFADDGTLTSSLGYIYFDSTRHTVPAYSQQLTQEGQGYVVFDTTGGGVVFARLSPQSGRVDWLDYEDASLLSSSTLAVIGKFNKIGTSIIDISTIPPSTTRDFERIHFMELLSYVTNDETLTDVQRGSIMDQWADALGIAQVFQSLAVWDFFANRIKTNHLEITKVVGSELFTLVLSNNEGSGYPIMQAYKGNTLIFEINSEDGSVFIKGSGEFEGTIVHEALETKAHQDGDPVSVVDTKDIWNTTELYNELGSVPTNGTVAAATGSYSGKAVNGITRLPGSSNRAILGSYSNPNMYERKATSGSTGEILLIGKFTVPGGVGRVTVSAEILSATYGEASFYISKNYYNSAAAMGYVNTDNTLTTNGGILIANAGPSGSSYVWTPVSYTFDISPGEVIYLWVRCDKDYSSWMKGQNAAATYYSSIVGPGVFLKYTDNSFGIIRPSQYRDDAFSLSSPQSWVHSSNLNFKKGDDVYNHAVVQSLTAGMTYPATGTVVADMIGSGSHTYGVQSIRRNANGVTFGTTEGEVAFLKWGGQGSSEGVYDGYSVSVVLVGQVRALRASSVLPKDNGDGKDQKLVGSGAEPFNAGHFNSLHVAGMPIYACRAWGVCNASGTMLGGEGISSTSLQSTGVMRFNFSFQFPDTNYAFVGSELKTGSDVAGTSAYSLATTYIEMVSENVDAGYQSYPNHSVVIFR